MSTSAISSGNSAIQALLTQSRQALQTLQTDLGSNNITGAQSDFAAFQQDAMQLFQGSNGKLAGQLASQTGTSQTTTDLQSLKSALSSGNVTGAQQALAAFQQDLQTQMKGRAHGHHHHHHQDSDSDQNSNSTSSNGTGITGAANSNGVPNSAMTLASLLSAYQAFNPSSAATTGTALSVLG